MRAAVTEMRPLPAAPRGEVVAAARQLIQHCPKASSQRVQTRSRYLHKQSIAIGERGEISKRGRVSNACGSIKHTSIVGAK